MSEIAEALDYTPREDSYLWVPPSEPAPNVLLLGFPGNGKTFSIASLLKQGLEVFVIFTEQGRESLFEGLKYYKVTDEERERLHWNLVKTASPGFNALKDIAKKLNTSNQKTLSNLDSISGNKYQQALDLINTCANYVDQHGVNYGDVSEWGNNRALVVDSLSGINDLCIDLVVGGKPVKSMSDWQIAMDIEMRLIKQLCNDTRCLFVLTGHLDREKEEVMGKLVITPSLIGTKNGTKIGRHFSDVIWSIRTTAGFRWTVKDPQMEQLKTRNLDDSKKDHPQDFGPLVTSWANRYRPKK